MYNFIYENCLFEFDTIMLFIYIFIIVLVVLVVCFTLIGSHRISLQHISAIGNLHRSINKHMTEYSQKSVVINSKPIDFNKIKCPYVRERVGSKYLITSELDKDMEWIFDDGVKAVDKLHGTNICIWVEKGVITAIDNRKNRIMNNPNININMNKNEGRIISGVYNSIEKGWLKNLHDGRHYGELIAPKINANLHQVDRPYFILFDYLLNECNWKSWEENRYPKDFDSISEWFKELPSLFSKKLGINVLGEGLVFYHPDGRKAKIRRDMFAWYKRNDN